MDDNVWPEFARTIGALGARWSASSGRAYRLTLLGKRLEVALERDALAALPAPDAIDEDLLELACAVYDKLGGEWSSDMLKKLVGAWTTVPEDY